MNRLRGVNFGGWLSQLDAIEEKDPASFGGPDIHMHTFIEETDFRRVYSFGFNHVRLPVDWEHFFAEDGSPKENRLHRLDDAFSFALANHLTLMLDLHKCPGHTFHDVNNAQQQIFSDESYVLRTLRIWSVLAERYGGFPNAIFEALNEPVAPDAVTWNRLKDRLCLAIRQQAPDTPIVTGSNMWHWPSTFAQLTPVPDDNVIYCFHFYEPLLFTHQQAPWLPEVEFRRAYAYPADYGPGVTRMYDLVQSRGRWDRSRMEDELAPVLRFRDAHHVTAICNEFGTWAGAPREDQLRWTADFLDVLKRNDIGWSYWNYKNLDFGIISMNERLHESLPRYNNPQSMDTELLALLRNG